MPQSIANQSLPQLGVSSCLLGHKVRYDGDHQYQPLIEQYLTRRFSLIHFCPEMAIGLGVPRPKIQLVSKAHQIVCLDQATETTDYTGQLAACCDSQKHWLDDICGYVFKTKSPSCGVTKVKTRIGHSLQPVGQGIFARELLERYPKIPVIEEDQLALPEIRTHFINQALEFHKNNRR